MGVWGLESFIHNEVPNGVFQVNILEEIIRRKSEFPDRHVTLVFQMVDILYNISQHLSPTERICGPAFQKIHEILVRSFQLLVNSGAELHFFLIGPSYNNNFQKWSQHESAKYSARINLLDKIDANGALDEIKNIEYPEGASALSDDLRAICETFGTVHVSINQKSIIDIVRYSNERSALAIVANDSNFLIFDGDWRYWSCRDIGLIEQNWTTWESNKSALREHIGLAQQQMPMLATIAGNSFVDFQKLREFHKKVHGQITDYRQQHFLKLADYVKQIPNPLTNYNKRGLIKDLFGSSDIQKFQIVRESLWFYKMKAQENQQVHSLLKSSAYISTVYHNSLTEEAIRIKSPPFFDMRRNDFLPYTEIALPVLKRQIGFVRHNKNDTHYQQVVQLKPSHSEPFLTIKVEPEYPREMLPDLKMISFNEDCDESLNNLRCVILKWMLFGRDFHRQFSIQDIPKGFMATVLAVMYLCKLKQLSHAEASAILLSTHLIRLNKDYAKDIQPPTSITTRDVIVSHLYIYVHNMVVRCFRFLGLISFADYLRFDGVYFIYWLNKIKMEDHEDDISKVDFTQYFLRQNQ